MKGLVSTFHASYYCVNIYFLRPRAVSDVYCYHFLFEIIEDTKIGHLGLEDLYNFHMHPIKQFPELNLIKSLITRHCSRFSHLESYL